jgi:choline-sulfatase
MRPKNLIFFMSDNHNQRVMGAAGHTVVQTPNLDRIAARGVRFENAYAASAICCPSRAALACGRFPHQTGYWDNCLVYDGTQSSWMGRLRQAGYHVASIGKLHYRSTEDDNGFSEELAPMHILDGVGGLVSLLRWSDEEPILTGQWELYSQESCVGTSVYQDFDRRVSELAIDWLDRHAGDEHPWALFVSYPSAHPPFSVPQRLWDLYPADEMPLPVKFRPGERLEHPALSHLRRILGYPEFEDETVLQQVTAGYFALVTHLDEQIGEVMRAAERVGVMDETRLIYTSDHGESLGQNGLMGKCQLLETGAAVPLLMCGPDIPQGKLSSEIVSHVDLFPTLLDGFDVEVPDDDHDLPGLSLWPALQGEARERIGFAEYHAAASRAASYMIRRGDWKLIHHAGGMPPQVFNLATDPYETEDLVDDHEGKLVAAELGGLLLERLDPEETDRRARRDQQQRAERFGGNDVIRKMGVFPYTPPPGVDPDIKSTE